MPDNKQAMSAEEFLKEKAFIDSNGRITQKLAINMMKSYAIHHAKGLIEACYKEAKCFIDVEGNPVVTYGSIQSAGEKYIAENIK